MKFAKGTLGEAGENYLSFCGDNRRAAKELRHLSLSTQKGTGQKAGRKTSAGS